MKKRFLVIVVTLVLMVLLAAGVNVLAASKLVVGVDAAPSTMDPLATSEDATWSVMANIFESLFKLSGPDNKLTPGLATKYEHPDKLTWKFYLRKGVKFQNGSPFTAADVKYTFERMKDPKCCSSTMETGKKVASIEIIDDYTVVIKTVKPVPTFDMQLSTIFIMDRESTQDREIGDISVNPIGTGPYALEKWTKGSFIKLRANKSYWDGAPAIDNIDIRPIKETSTRFAALVSGQVDMISGIPIELYENIAKNPAIEIKSRPGRRPMFMPLTNKPGTPMADIRVRKAINMAINIDEIITNLFRGQAMAISQAADSAMIGYAGDIKRLPYDPEQAKKLLAEAGYADGFEITISGPNDRYIQDEKVCEAVAKYLTKVGIKAKLNVMPKAVYWPEVQKGEFECYLIGWLSNSYDWGENYSYLMHTFDAESGRGSWNGVRYSKPELDKIFMESNYTVDPQKRHSALQELNRKVMADCYAIPLYLTLDTYALTKSKGISFTPRADRWLIFQEISLR